MVLTLLDLLNPSVFDPSVCVLGHGPFVEALQGRGVPVRGTRCYRGSKDIGFLLRLTSVVKSMRPNVIHAHMWPASLYSSLCGRLLGIPVICTFHSNYNLESWYERFSLRLTYWACSRIAMVCQHQVKHFGFSEHSSKCLVVHNGVVVPEEVEARALSQREVTKGDLKLDPQSQVITFVANLRPVKGHSILLEAFRRLSEANSSLRLLLVGDGPLSGSLQEQCKAFGLSSKVLFLGAREDVLDLLAMTDVFVSSSFSEALSMAIIEAMTMGLPVVATDVGGNGELIDHGVNGLLVPHGDPRAFAEALLSVLKDRERAARMGAEAKVKARKCFGARRMVEQYGELYRAVTST
jgi:glycosyltransferase involved in cell wall biosynthesis